MTTADHRPGGACAAALRWTRTAVIALVATLAVLVHHETAAAVTHASPSGTPGASGASGTSSMAGIHHAATAATSVSTGGRTLPPGVIAPTAAHDDDGACSGAAMQHCAAAGVDSLKPTPPCRLSTGCVPALPTGAAGGQAAPGTTGRAPPDLSVLSRLLL
ncbi:hypothetical protein [Streptomyces sp. NPDC059175]|uniref:hypothetical protein n=1 Tax=unclassified Streptomyces TaxID=2593676 RepID=UPI0036C89357